MKTIVICSGGLDSVSLAHRVAAEHDLLGLLSFDYGQRHRKELDFAAACATRLNVPHQIIDLRAIGQSLSGSALTDDVAVQAALNISLDTLNAEWRATLPAAERTPEPVAAPDTAPRNRFAEPARQRPATPISGTSSGFNLPVWIWLAGGLGALLIVVGGVWVMREARQR